MPLRIESDEERTRNEIRELMKAAEWDFKARDYVEGREKLHSAKDLAKTLRDEKLINDILKQIDQSINQERESKKP